jgi:predicted transcriptional regulator
MKEGDEYITMTTEIVAAYVANNTVVPSDLPALIRDVFQALCETRGATMSIDVPNMPAVPVRKSVAQDHLVCLECGKRFKSLKRHLATHHSLLPDAYRKKWTLQSDYPMVAPNYARARSALAREMGLGQRSDSRRRRRTRKVDDQS